MPSLMLARPLQAILWGFWVLLDCHRNPDLSLVVPWNAAKVKHHMSGFSDWRRIRTFDAMERSTAIAVGNHFEIQSGLTTYYHRMPDSISTHDYPTSYGLAGRLIPLSEDSTRVVARFRLTSIRSLAYGSLILAAAFLSVVGFTAIGLIQSGDFAFFTRVFLQNIPLTLPLAALVAAVIGDLIAPDRQKTDLINHLGAMFGEYKFKSA